MLRDVKSFFLMLQTKQQCESFVRLTLEHLSLSCCSRQRYDFCFPDVSATALPPTLSFHASHFHFTFGSYQVERDRSSRLGFLVLVCFPEECVFPKYPTLEPCLAVGVDLHPCSRQEKHPSHQTATCAPPFISHPWLDLQQEQKHFQYEQNGGNTRRTLTIKFQAIFISRCSFGKVIFPPVPIRRQML